MAKNLNLARKDSVDKNNVKQKGWDSKLKDIGTSWDKLDTKYQNVLTSLAYNVGGTGAGQQWKAVLQAAKDENILDFAKELRREDGGKITKGMDNRVIRELYAAGIIDSFEDVSSVGLPLELITMLFSTILGGVMSIWGQSNKSKAEQNKMLLARANFQADQVNAARNAGKTDSHFAWTRRLIALSAVGSIIVLPKVVAVWYPDVSVIVGYTEVQGGFMNWLFGPEDAIQWKSARGFVITPLDTHIVSAIVGLYFGAGFTK